MIKIAIVEDNKMLRENLIKVFELLDELHIVFSAKDGEDAILKMDQSLVKPQLILMDIEMQKMNGITATKIIKEKYQDVKILMLTVFDTDLNINKSFAAGADGYLLKDEKPLRILQLIKDSIDGRLSMSPNVAAKSLRILSDNLSYQNSLPSDFGLTPRELDVLKLLTHGNSHSQIALQLFVSPKTVRNHFENIYRKMDVHSKVEASNMAVRNRWFEVS